MFNGIHNFLKVVEPGRLWPEAFLSVLAGFILAFLITFGLWSPKPAMAMMPADQDDPSTITMPENAALMLQTGDRWTDDLPELRKRGVVRVLVEYSRTDFFVVRGELFGFECELLKQYESFINRDRHGSLRTRVVFVPMALGDLIPALLAGKGDIAAAGLTITPDREKLVAFSSPYVEHVSEVLVSAKNAVSPGSLEGLAGRTVCVVRGSSHAEHLHSFSNALAEKGAGKIEVVEAPGEFTEEDLLEMTNAGIYPYIIVDSRTADIWAKVLPNIVVHPDIRLASDGRIAWAVRKENRELLASIDDYFHSDKDSALANARKLIPKYYENTQWVINPNGNVYTDKLREYAVHFRSSCKKFDFDWLMAVALAFQESRFNETLVSRVGAVGLMQVLPRTGASLGFRNVRPPRDNIQAGVCYLEQLREHDFADPAIPEDQKLYFMMAAYNAGPNRINRLRSMAQKMGLNPNEWFGNVEYVAMNALGEDVLNYVANIKKYYAAYKLSYALGNKRIDRLQEFRKHSRLQAPNGK